MNNTGDKRLIWDAFFNCSGLNSDKIPAGYVDKKRYPSFMARAMLKELIATYNDNQE